MAAAKKSSSAKAPSKRTPVSDKNDNARAKERREIQARNSRRGRIEESRKASVPSTPGNVQRAVGKLQEAKKLEASKRASTRKSVATSVVRRSTVMDNALRAGNLSALRQRTKRSSGR